MSPQIPAQQARRKFTQAQIAAYQDLTTPTGFFRSLFKVEEKTTKELSIEVRRHGRKIAVDVERGDQGNRNTVSKSTQKVIVPPLYDEFVDITEMDAYDELFNASGSVSNAQVARLVRSINSEVLLLQQKIERAIELQCAQVLEDGIVQLNAGTNIDFKRKAGSKVDHTGNPWDNAATDPFDAIEAGCEFVRNEGKYEGAIFNMVVGKEAINAMQNNAKFQAKANLRNVKLMELTMPMQRQTGATLFGQISAGSFTVNVWTYTGVYENSAGTTVNYMPSKKFILTPEDPEFHLGFGAVPQLVDEGIGVQPGAFLIQDFKDARKAIHEYVVKSAPIAIPTAVDQIYTGQVLS